MKILKILLLFVFTVTSFGQSFALTMEDGSTKVLAFEKIIEKRYGDRLAKLDTQILGKLTSVIEKRMAQLDTESDGSIATKTQQTLDVYIAFSNVIDDYYSLALEVEEVLGDEPRMDLVITIISDTRCDTCNAEGLEKQLRTVPDLKSALILTKDFSEEGIADIIESNGIKYLPAVVFSHNDVGPELSQYMTKLSGGSYSLAVGASFDPFEIRSDRGFRVLDSVTHASILKDAHIKGIADAEITWIEYTDILCHYCKKMAIDETVVTILSEYPDDVNMAYSNFIGVGGDKSRKAAELLECSASLGGAEVYNKMIQSVLKYGKSSEAEILALGVENGIDEVKLQACYDNGESKALVTKKYQMGISAFNVTGTPGNVLINNKTREYVKVPGAYPVSKFREVVESLLED